MRRLLWAIAFFVAVIICFVLLKSTGNRGVASVAQLIGEQSLPSENMAIPPAPPDNAPILRADQKVRQQTHVVSRSPSNPSAAPTHEPQPSVATAVASTPIASAIEGTRYNPPGSNRGFMVKKDEVLVKFHDGITPEQRDNVLTEYGAVLVPDGGTSIASLGYSRIRLSAKTSVQEAMASFSSDPLVMTVEPNALVRPFSVSSDDPLVAEQWGLQATHAVEAWSMTEGHPDVIIAVVDSGVDLDHPDLVNSLVNGYNFVDTTQPPDDEYGHGTQVAGIIVAEGNNGVGIVGVAPKCRVMPLKVLNGNGEGLCSDVVAAILYAADHGCRVINLSLGTYFHSKVLESAVAYAAQADCVIVAAGGNDGSGEPCYPAAYAQAVGVGALRQSLVATRFSNRATYIDVSAPGRHIQTTTRDGAYDSVDGTSASAAHVAGVAALMLSRDRTLSQDIVRAAIMSSAQDLEAQGWDNATGMGIIDCVDALSSPNACLADAGIVDVAMLPRSPLPGQTANVYVTVRNHGAEASRPLPIMLKSGEATVARGTVPAMLPKAVSEVLLPWPVSADTVPGPALLVVAMSPVPSETEIKGNIYEEALTIASNAVHDVGLFACSVHGLPAVPGELLSITATLANTGNADVNLMNAKLFFEEREVYSNAVSHLPVGTKLDLSLRWKVPEEAPPWNLCRGFKLHLLVEGPPEDSMKRNNAKTMRLKLSNGGALHLFPLHKVDAGDEVHQWIAKEAYDFFVSQIEGSSLGSYLTRPGLTPSSSWSSLAAATHSYSYDGNDNVLEGTRDEDTIGLPNNHFCAGAEGSELTDGWASSSSAYTTAEGYRSSNWTSDDSSSFFYLGRYVHLLADMTVPAHVHNDEHYLPGDSEPYEEDVASFGYYDDFEYGGTLGSHAWNLVIARPTTTEGLFRSTADYTEDYDSEDEAGDWDGPSGQPYLHSKHDDALSYPVQYHHPELVDGSGINGMSSDETWNTALDLIPFAIYRTAQAYRYFYYKIDSTVPSVAMTYPTTEDVDNPTVRNSLSSFNLTASASDSQSGILKKGYQYKWAYYDQSSSSWSSWYDVSPSPTTTSVSFAPTQGETLYAFQVEGENGGGRQTWSSVKYLRIQLPSKIIALSGNLTFGSVQVGSTAQGTLRISNNGNSTLTISSISYPSGFSGAWSGTVSAGGYHDVTVTFAPTSASSYGGTITVNSDKTSGTNTRTCSGSGTAAMSRIISLSGNLTFGSVQVGSTAQGTLRISNNGNSTLTISSISYPSGFSGAWSGTVSAGGYHDVTVTFAPTSASSYGGTITVNSDKTSGTNTGSCSGAGTGLPTAAIPVGPTGTQALGERRPEFSWQTAVNASWYHIWVTRIGSGTYVAKWVQAPTTSWTPDVDFGGGDYRWWIAGWNTDGYGPWSSGTTFTIPQMTPGKIVLAAPLRGVCVPLGILNYQWYADVGATWYELWCDRNGSAFSDNWYRAADIVSGSSASILGAILDWGDYVWYVRGWGPDGMGKWSYAGEFFSGRPSCYTGSASELIWDDSRTTSAGWYNIVVKDTHTGTRARDQWFRQIDASDAGSGKRSISLSPVLPSGGYEWSIRAWSSVHGLGPWSSAQPFLVTGGSVGGSIIGTWVGNWSGCAWTITFDEDGTGHWGQISDNHGGYQEGVFSYTFTQATGYFEAFWIDSYYWLKGSVSGDSINAGWYRGGTEHSGDVVITRTAQ